METGESRWEFHLGADVLVFCNVRWHFDVDGNPRSAMNFLFLDQ